MQPDLTAVWVALGSAWVLCTLVLPRLWHLVPVDRGRAYAVGSDRSTGKPVGVGVIVVAIAVATALPFAVDDTRVVLLLLLLLGYSWLGLADDRRPGGLSAWTLAVADAVVALVASIVIFYGQPLTLHVPAVSLTIALNMWVAVGVFAPVMWLSVNAVNCTDGVDGLAGALACTTFLFLGMLLCLGVDGSVEAALFTLTSAHDRGSWLLICCAFGGSILGYLKYNFPPSVCMMGDAGSRPIGLLIGVMITIIGDPFILITFGLVFVGNGLGGLIKIALLRGLGAPVLSLVRFPLHDHVRAKLGWTDNQVLYRFLFFHIFVNSLLFSTLLILG